MNPVRNDAGTILNPAQLDCDAVVGQRVLCPACGLFVFQLWPEGWDAHAANTCKGLISNTPGARKDEFKGGFKHLFRPEEHAPVRFNPDMERVFGYFSQIYLGGIPSIITQDSAFLAFVCTLTAVEALAGYRYGDESPGDKFKDFICGYFPVGYTGLADELWSFRNSMVHAFSTGKFVLVHHKSEYHLSKQSGGSVVLNAEDFYAALVSAAQKFFFEARNRLDLQEILLNRLRSEMGGPIAISTMGVRSGG
jgi:hypothetical protein